jgi:hypothetical protein
MSAGETPPLSIAIGGPDRGPGHDLAEDLIGTVSFTEMFLLDLNGTKPPLAYVRVVDGGACCVDGAWNHSERAGGKGCD